MPGRRRIKASPPIRSSLANAAFAVEERVVWGGADLLSRILDAVRWPFERAVWAIERGLVWPLEDRTGDLNGRLRAAGIAALALVAAGAGVLGLLWASGSGGSAGQVQRAASLEPAPIVRAAPQEKLAPAVPALHGAAPDFSREADGGVATGEIATSGANADAGASPLEEVASTASKSAPTGAAAAEPAGPAATKVARRFAGAFVLYEIGKTNSKVRSTFTATATPQLAHGLLQRPPRLPADAKVPRAKVLNVVPGPVEGSTYSLSVSLLRVGVTSELRIDVQRDEDTGKWLVTDVRG